jgi:hypothetical protein
MTAWTDFVREYAAKHNVSYKTAMSQASESYKNRGTTQVKRNVAQRGLADIANLAKTSVAKKQSKKQEFIKRTGIPEGLLQSYVDFLYVSTLYHNVAHKIDKPPKKVKEALRKFHDKILELFRFIPTKGNESVEDYFEPSEDYDNDDLGIGEYTDAKGEYYWEDDAVTYYINHYTDQAEEVLKEIMALDNDPDPRVEKKYLSDYGKIFYALKKPDKFGFTPIWPFSDNKSIYDSLAPVEHGSNAPVGLIKPKGRDWFFRFEYPNKAVEAFYKEVDKFANRGASLKDVLDKFF